MTTILSTRDPFEILKMSQSVTRRRSKRLANYDEEDDDFVFTRVSKRVKKQPLAPEVTPVTVTKKSRKSKNQPVEHDHESNTAIRKPKEGKRCLSTPKSENNVVVSKRREADSSSTRTIPNAEKRRDNDEIGLAENYAQGSKRTPHLRLQKQSTIVPLPLSDTPVISRNKEFRKKARGSDRRSSLGLRGRRASSLIDSGRSAIPHHEVETSDFYKHIEVEGLSEPRRMKQLLTWVGERCMGPKPSHGDPDSAAELAGKRRNMDSNLQITTDHRTARHIKEALLSDISKKSEFSDWFNREEKVPEKVVKKPNPRNVEIESNILAMEERLKILRDERDRWKALAKPATQLPPLIPPDKFELELSQIDTSLLDPEQVTIFEEASMSSASGLREQASNRLKELQSTLEIKVDQFMDGVHKLEQYQEAVGRVADKILFLSAKRLEEHNRREKEKIGTRDLPMKEVLRSLSRILPERKNG
ncbi:hypothetical protein Golomagni_02217 [Golovinomyces magnicellulatus]|nr:hypothetical protein Golomagni_02217 [Golovinomyces magnicellulatus]